MPSSRQALMLVRPEGPAPITATLCTMVELHKGKRQIFFCFYVIIVIRFNSINFQSHEIETWLGSGHGILRDCAKRLVSFK